MPSVAVLAGLILIVSFGMSHSNVVVDGTDWVEPVLLWISICMPTGSGKSSLCKYLRQLVEDARSNRGLDDSQPSWFLDDQSFEKMGALMHDNDWKLLGLYDELPMFFSQINVFRGRGLSDSHELAVFLQLYGGRPWVRKTGKPCSHAISFSDTTYVHF
jgi:energy-coupling factor transporter ATP-binding protein EcfA2